MQRWASSSVPTLGLLQHPLDYGSREKTRPRCSIWRVVQRKVQHEEPRHERSVPEHSPLRNPKGHHPEPPTTKLGPYSAPASKSGDAQCVSVA